MKLRILAYYFRHALSNLFGDRLINAVSIGTLSISLLLFGSFLLLFVNLSNWILDWGQSFSMSIYLSDGIDEKRKKDIELILRDLQGAELVGFVSKEKAMMELTEGLGPQSGLLDGLAENPLPASFELVFSDVKINQIDPVEMKEHLEEIDGVEEVQYTEQWLRQFEDLIYILKVAGFIIGGLLCLAVLFIITNTIKLTIYSRRDEIEIIKLVGATDWFIKIPLLIEGTIQGILSGLIALSILFLSYILFSLKKVQVLDLPILHIVFLPSEYVVFLLCLSLGLGLMGSLIAVGRFFSL